MGRFLPFLIAALAALYVGKTVAEDDWAACEVPTPGHGVSVTSCYSGSPNPYPDVGGGCPMGQLMKPDEIVSKVQATFPAGSICNGNGAKFYGGRTLVTDTQFGYFVKCGVVSDPDNYSEAGILGAKACTDGCPFENGERLSGNSFSQTLASSTGTFCYQGCEVQLRNFGLSISASGVSEPAAPVFFEVTAPQCLDNYAETPVPVGGDYCTTAAGHAVCARTDASLTIDDVPVAVGATGELCADGQCVEPGQVVTSSDGAQFAQTGTPTPPSPDTGVAGDLAPSDLTIDTTGAGSGGGTYWYWSTGTVGGSTTAPPGGGSGGDGDGDGDGQSCGAPDEPACKVEFDGEFTKPELDGSTPTFSDALTQFRERVSGSVVGQALTSIAASVPEGGSPPSASFTLEALGSETFTYEVPQAVIDVVVPVLSIVMLLVWALIALILFFKG